MSKTDKEPYKELIGKILGKLEFFISSNMEKMFKETDEFLFKSAESATSIADQNNNFEFMNALRSQKDNLQQNLINEYNKYLKSIAESPELPKKKHSKESNQLGLIEQDEMDEMVALKTISSKSEMNLQEELSHLEARFEFLAIKNKNIFHAKALKAQYFCDALQDILVFSDLTNPNKLTLIKMFGQHFVSQLKTLYDEINQLMIYEGILPQIELSGKIKKTEDHAGQGHDEVIEEENVEPSGTTSARQGGSGYRGSHGGSGQQGGGQQAGGGSAGGGQQGGGQQAGGGFAGGGQQGGGQQAGGDFAGGGQQGGGQQAGGGSAGGGQQGGGQQAGGGFAGGGQQGGGQQAGGGFAGGGQQGGGQQAGGGSAGGSQQADGAAGAQDGSASAAGGRMSAGRPAAQINQSIQGFVGGVPADSDSALPSGGGGYYTHGDVVGALSNLQVNNELLPDTNLGFDSKAIKKALLSAIGDSKGGVVDKRVHQVSEKTIDFIKLIFDAIIDDKGISDAIKALLLSLQIPIIKAAMIDPDFFVDDDHPARLLLDKIAEAGVGVMDHKDPVYVDVDKVVKTLLKEYKEDIAAFEDALNSLTELTEEIYRKAREQEEVSQQEVQHRHARTVVLQEIRKVTLGKELPAKIRTLVLKVWPSLMFNHYLNHGKANDEWVEMLIMLDRIVDSVQPVSSLADLEELGFSSDDLVDAAREKLHKCGKTGKIVDQVMDDLKATYDDMLAKKESLQKAEKEGKLPKIKPKKVVEPEISAADEQEETSEQIARRKLDKLSDDVQPSSWFIVYNGEDKPVRRLKLAVILVQDATLVFVDHLGNVVIEKDAEEFEIEIEKGLSGLIMQHSVFDHALNAALDTIKK